MKKVAPPPPPPPLANGNARRASGPPADYHRSSIASSTPGEDCAIDERLEGRVDVDLVLPDYRVVRMNLDRKTPMMDLLVQATTANRISPSGHVLSVVSSDECSVPFQPNTPLGSLDPRTLYLVPKASLGQPVKRMPKLANQPFEQTFRVQVNLPRQQRMVVRASPRDSLDALHRQVCADRDLDPAAHHLVHPAHPHTALDRAATLDRYGYTEITLMSTADLKDSIQSSYNNLSTYQKPKIEEEKRRRGILRLFSRKKKDQPPGEVTSHYLPTSQSDNALNRHQPKHSLKRKPAPPPPLAAQSCSSLSSRPESALSLQTADDGSVSHSRHSSDSSGYHEPSVFSDCSENKSPELHADRSPLHMADSNLSAVPSASSASLARKRRAPQPPLPAIESPDDDPRRHSCPDAEAQQEAIQYLEHVLQESDGKAYDSDTDSQRDEGEVISVCQAEVHADANDSSDSVVEPDTVVTPEPALPEPRLPPPPEAADPSADDSGISQSLNSDADSSLPSLHSEPKACPEEIYCNVLSDSLDSKLVPSNNRLPDEDILCTNSTELETNHHGDLQENIIEDQQPISLSAPLATEPVSNGTTQPQEAQTPPVQETSSEDVPSAAATAVSEPEVAPETTAVAGFPDIKCNSDKNSAAGSVSSDSARNSVTHSPQVLRKLDNFALGCYKKDVDIDIYSEPIPKSERKKRPPDENTEIEAPAVADDKSQFGMTADIVQSPQEKDIEISAMPNSAEVLPVTARSTSLSNLIPQPYQRTAIDTERERATANEALKRTHSQQIVENHLEALELKETFRQEQRRLHEEYKRLQEQFLSWQKQLMNNQNLLQSERIVPAFPEFPTMGNFNTLEDRDDRALKSVNEKVDLHELKTKSLPRPKTKPLSLKEPSTDASLPQTPTTPTLVDIDIGREYPVQRPASLSTIESEDSNLAQDDKTVQVPSPQDEKNTQAPSPQEKVTLGTQAPSPETVLNKDTSAQTGDSLKASSPESSSPSSLSPDSESNKWQTLPRPKFKPSSASQPTRTMTLNRGSRPKSQVVAVTIGSWQQRQSAAIADIEPSSVASSRSKFMSLENIPQSASKPTIAPMERRKLPPVPNEVNFSTAAKTVQAKSEAPAVKAEQTGKGEAKPDAEKTKTVRSSPGDSRTSNTIPKQVEAEVPRQKMDIKIAAKEPSATFKLAKPFVKLTSMKDEPHTPSIIGLRKWPLSEMTETRDVLDDLRSGSRKPNAHTQEKIRRAEVDLRKPKVKPEQPKPKAEEPKVHITKVSLTGSKPPAQLPRSNTLPKSLSLNNELMSVFARKAEDAATMVKAKAGTQTVTINGSAPPPPPPPPPQPSAAGMPAIPPAEQIPVSSQLVMAGHMSGRAQAVSRRESKKSLTQMIDPREELMLEIRGFGGKQALRKAPSSRPGWNLKVFGAASTVN